MFKSINNHPSGRELKKFALTLMFGMPVAGAIWTLIIWWSREVLNLWILAGFAISGALLGLTTLLSGSAGRMIYIGWHSCATILETVISFVSTLFMYALTILPIGLIMRLCGRKSLPLRDPKQKSYWQEHKDPENLKRYFRQY